jgi:hypothetical protein
VRWLPRLRRNLKRLLRADPAEVEFEIGVFLDGYVRTATIRLSPNFFKDFERARTYGRD